MYIIRKYGHLDWMDHATLQFMSFGDQYLLKLYIEASFDIRNCFAHQLHMHSVINIVGAHSNLNVSDVPRLVNMICFIFISPVKNKFYFPILCGIANLWLLLKLYSRYCKWNIFATLLDKNTICSCDRPHFLSKSDFDKIM